MFQFSSFASASYVFRCRYTLRCGFPHSDICGSMLVCQLPAAFRRLPRLSSPVIAKASATCTYSCLRNLKVLTLLDFQSLPVLTDSHQISLNVRFFNLSELLKNIFLFDLSTADKSER